MIDNVQLGKLMVYNTSLSPIMTIYTHKYVDEDLLRYYIVHSVRENLLKRTNIVLLTLTGGQKPPLFMYIFHFLYSDVFFW